MSTFFVILGLFLLLQSLLSLAAAARFAHYCLRPRFPRQNRYQPKAVVIVPCKGIDEELEENLRPLLVQEYREYEVIFVTESATDPAHELIARMLKQTRRSAWLIAAGDAHNRGQKVHNLCAALDALDSIDRKAEILVFADSDARPTRQWLAELIAPLGDKRIGATTGFRWYLPIKGGLLSQLLSVWNSSALGLLGENSGFAWGGSTAIRRETFEKLNIRKRWEGAVSDDYALTAALKEAGQRIKFIPQCLVASHADIGLKDLLEFTTRQMRITRVYSPSVWKLAAVSHTLYNLTFWGGLVWMTGPWRWMLAAIYLLGASTGLSRAMVASRLIDPEQAAIRKQWWAHALLGPLSSLLYLYNLLASAHNRRIVWRGIGYDLLSPTETVIRHRPAPRNPRENSPRSPKHREASVRSSSQKR
ncbi:MAG: glycosyltransferase family 2 protein [Blastocatellia bacterium]|nr:glycosyltransferase family 2 protein [Blastocatellia bacterium]